MRLETQWDEQRVARAADQFARAAELVKERVDGQRRLVESDRVLHGEATADVKRGAVLRGAHLRGAAFQPGDIVGGGGRRRGRARGRGTRAPRWGRLRGRRRKRQEARGLRAIVQ